MLDAKTLKDMWEWDGMRRLNDHYAPNPKFTMQGAGTLIARAITDASGRSRLDLSKDLRRAAALLSVAYDQTITAPELIRLRAASDAWHKGDLCLAYIVLEHAGLGRLREGAAKRLYWADRLLAWGTTPEELAKGLHYEIGGWFLDKASAEDPKNPGWPKGTPGGLGGKFRPKDDTGVSPWMGHNGGPPMPPTIPNERPIDGKVRSAIIKGAVKWAIRAGLAAADITAPEIVIPIQLGIEIGSWAYPYISAYFEGPKSLDELQRAVRNPQPGYEIHHIVEQTPARISELPSQLIDGPDNLVRIPTLKHWELNRWYETPNESTGGITPREYLKDKDWEERRKIGLEGLQEIGVLNK